MSERPDLISALIMADAAERERLLRSVEPTTLEMALPQLGRRREPAAAEVLAMIDHVVEDRAVRKAARRELHRLRSIGVQAPEASQPTVNVEDRPRAAEAPLPVSEAWATDIDPSGSRALWLLGERPLGGVWFAPMLVNEQRGVQDLNLIDTTRKRFLREFEASQRGPGIWVSLPGPYALALVREAVDLTRAHGGGLPTRYHAMRDVFGEAAAPPERALIYETISPVEANFNSGWLEESPRLTAEPEVAGWHITVGVDFRQRAVDAARAPATGLLVPGHTPEEQVQQLLVDAAHDAFGSDVRRALRRRLEETAYIFAQTNRLAAAHLAVGAAQGLEDSGAGPRVAAERHPLVRLLLASGLTRLVGNETVGGRRVAEVLVDLVKRSAQREGQSAPVETRPSGLILPR